EGEGAVLIPLIDNPTRLHHAGGNSGDDSGDDERENPPFTHVREVRIGIAGSAEGGYDGGHPGDEGREPDPTDAAPRVLRVVDEAARTDERFGTLGLRGPDVADEHDDERTHEVEEGEPAGKEHRKDSYPGLPALERADEGDEHDC